MTTEEFIITLFCQVDDQTPEYPKHSQAKLYPSELVTIGLLFALKGGSFRSCYRWLQRDYEVLFNELPDRTAKSKFNNSALGLKRKSKGLTAICDLDFYAKIV